jgi:hypothetical protein
MGGNADGQRHGPGSQPKQREQACFVGSEWGPADYVIWSRKLSAGLDGGRLHLC